MNEVVRRDKRIEYVQIMIALGLVALMIAPLLMLAAQAYPTANDYVALGDYMRFRGDGLSQLQSALGGTAILYSQGQGAFLSGLLAGLIVDTDTVPVFCCLIVGGFFISVFIATKNVIRYIFGCHRLSLILWVYLGIVFLMTQFTNPAESFFWFSGTVMYTLPVMSMFFGIGVALKSIRYPKPRIRLWLFIGGAALLFFACGGALVTGMFLCWVAIGGTISAFHRRTAWRKKALILLLVCACGFLLNVLAPVFSTATQSVPGGNLFFADTGALETAPPIIVVTVLLALLIPVVNIAKHCGYGFRHPFRCVAFSVIAALLLVVPYAVGDHHAMRLAYTETVTWFVLVLVFFNFAYLIGWGVKEHGFSIDNSFRTGVVVLVTIVSLASAVGIAQNTTLVSYGIARDCIEGTIQSGRNETERILDELRNSSDQALCIKRADNQYKYLREFVLSEDPLESPNPLIAQYYGKESVRYEVKESCGTDWNHAPGSE